MTEHTLQMERAALQGKLIRLGREATASIENKLSIIDRDLLDRQHASMSETLHVMQLRIARSSLDT